MKLYIYNKWIVNIIDNSIIEDNKDELTRPSSIHRSECLLQIRDLESSLACGAGGFLRGISDKGPDLQQW